MLFQVTVVPPIPVQLCNFYTLSIICVKGSKSFSLTSLRTRQAGSLAIEHQGLTLSIIQLADKDWLINKNSLLTQMTIYFSLIVRWWVISHIYHSCFLYIIPWLHFLSWMFLNPDYRFLALIKAGRTGFLFSLYPHINTWNLIHITRFNLLFKVFQNLLFAIIIYWLQNRFICLALASSIRAVSPRTLQLTL